MQPTRQQGYGVYLPSNVKEDRSGHHAEAAGDAESIHADFDTAYEAAQEAGGNRWVIHRLGNSEYVA